MTNTMAAILEAEVVDLADDAQCIAALHRARFTLADIDQWLEEAQATARRLRAQMAEEDAQA